MKTRWLVLVACLGCFAVAAAAANWPQWRGPERNGISQETGLLKEWPKEGPKLLWQVKDIGSGYSTPAVVGERLYLLSNQGMEDEFVKALQVKDGKQAWSTRLGKVGNPDQKPSYPASRSTPTVDGDLLYALGSNGDLVCLERSTGKVRWQKNLRIDFSGQPGIWAYAESPLIDGEVLVCTPGGADATLAALNKKTGKLLWKSSVPGGEQAAYASVIATTVSGVKHYVQFLQKGLVGIDANNGKFLWRYDKTAQGSPANIATPVSRDGYIYSATGRGGAGLIKVKMMQDSAEVEQVYASPKLPASPSCAPNSRQARSSGPSAESVLVPSATPTAACTCMERTGTWHWWKRRRKATVRRVASRRLTNQSGASPKPGPTQSLPTDGSMSAILASCGATTSRKAKRAANH
jgi:hypothetical protein